MRRTRHLIRPSLCSHTQTARFALCHRIFPYFSHILATSFSSSSTSISSSLASSLSMKQIMDQAEKLTQEQTPLTLIGWVKSFRFQKHMTFLELTDGTNFYGMQASFPAETTRERFKGVLAIGMSVSIPGVLVKRPENTKIGYDFEGKDIEILGSCDPNSYPLQKKAQGLAFLRNNQHLRPRTIAFSAMLRIRSCAFLAFHSFFQKEGFLSIQTPVITPLDCEGAGELFQAQPATQKKGDEPFFGRDSFLTVSGQLYAELVSNSHRYVYTFGPTFRAEKSDTTHHLAEFWMLEPEIAFASLGDTMTICQRALQYVTAEVMKSCKDDINFFDNPKGAWNTSDTETKSEREFREKSQNSQPSLRIKALLDGDFARVTYTEAIEILGQHADKFKDPPPVWGDDLKRVHEMFLTEEVFKRPVFVTKYPKSLKPFYMRPSEPQVAGRETVDCLDLLVPNVGELVGGSQREERFEKLQKRMQEFGMNMEDYSWYLDLRRYGTVPHSGFGLGFERYLQFLTGFNVRDLTLVPRAFGVAPF